MFRTSKNYKYLGILAENITRKIAKNLNLKNRNGVIVTTVEQYSPAFEAGVEADDIILEVGDQTIVDIKMFQRIISSIQKGRVIIVKIKRVDTTFHAFVEIPKP